MVDIAQEILAELQAINAAVDRLSAKVISGKDIRVIAGLSEITEKLGLIQAGEFRSGNSIEPGSGFSGVRVLYPPASYNGEEWNIVGVEDDVLQVGIRASDGKLIAGAGAVMLDKFGISAGSDLSLPASTSFKVFVVDQTYNSEAMGAGDVLLGDNSTGEPNILWDASEGTLKYRTGILVTGFMGSGDASGNIGVRVHLSTTQEVGLSEPIVFDTVDYDDGGFFLSTPGYKFTIPVGQDGHYLIGGAGVWVDSATAPILSLIKNDNLLKPLIYDIRPSGAVSHNLVTEEYLIAGDTVQLNIAQTAGSDRTFNLLVSADGDDAAEFWLRRTR